MADQPNKGRGAGAQAQAGAPPATGQARIVWDDSKVFTAYANIAQVKASREEIMILFGAGRTAEADEKELRVQLNERIILNPFAAKRLAIQLNNAIREYESKFGYLDGKTVVQEKLEPTPPLQPPLFRSAKGAEKVGLLFQFLDDQKIRPAFERSCEFLEKRLLENRFLLGFEKRMIQWHPDEKLVEICQRLGMPADFLDSFRENLPEASIVGFGFGEDEGTCMVKAYLEFGARFFRAIMTKPSDPGPYLSHLGFKWDAEDITRKALAKYTCHPSCSREAMLKSLSEDFYGLEGAGPFNMVKGILDLAANKVSQDRFLYLDVKEENNPRSSFDINVYKANLQLRDVHTFLLDMCRHYSISEERFHTLYEPIKGHILGHIAGGIDRDGRDFVTLYFGE
jgi:hypothetical protein